MLDELATSPPVELAAPVVFAEAEADEARGPDAEADDVADRSTSNRLHSWQKTPPQARQCDLRSTMRAKRVPQPMHRSTAESRTQWRSSLSGSDQAKTRPRLSPT